MNIERAPATGTTLLLFRPLVQDGDGPAEAVPKRKRRRTTLHAESSAEQETVRESRCQRRRTMLHAESSAEQETVPTAKTVPAPPWRQQPWSALHRPVVLPVLTLVSYGRLKESRWAREQTMDLVIDCERYGRDRTESNVSGEEARGDDERVHTCCGQNGRTLLVWATTAMRYVLQELKAFLHRRQSARSLTIGFRCKQGRHRSYASAELAEHACALARYEVRKKHLDTNSRSERPPCGCPDSCTQLPTRFHHRELQSAIDQFRLDGHQAFRIVAELWHEV